MISAPTFADVLAAQRFLAEHISPTPLVRREALADATGLDLWLKCEFLLPTAAFKVRGGLNLIGRDETARAGVVAASTGNHGQSLAYAGKVFGVPVTIYHPRAANPLKLAAMRRYGATLVEAGADYDDAREACERDAAATGRRYVHSGNEPFLIAGVATATVEALGARPDLEVLVVPVGGGSGAAGAVLASKNIDPRVQVIGVQSDGAPAAYRSWKAGQPLPGGPIATFAEGLATRTAFALPQAILHERLDGFVLVSDDEILRAMRLLLVEAHLLVEGAAAASVAAAVKLRDRLVGKQVACWLTGANATAESIERALRVELTPRAMTP